MTASASCFRLLTHCDRRAAPLRYTDHGPMTSVGWLGLRVVRRRASARSGGFAMRALRTPFAVIAACLAPLGAEAGDILNLGDAAPPLAVSGWVKGEKVE